MLSHKLTKIQATQH